MLKLHQKVYAVKSLVDWMPFFCSRESCFIQNASLRPMKFLTQPSRSQAGPWLSAISATLLTALAVGCASPGPPRPPSLRLPEVVKDLTAERVGDEVHLRWTTPTKTTDKLEIKGSLTAEICRGDASVCTPVKRLPVHPGSSEATDALPVPLTVDPASLLLYRVRILNVNERSAGQSSVAFAAAGAAPPPVEKLRATSVRAGAMLEWQPRLTVASVQLDRLIDGATVPTKEPRPRPNPKSDSAAPSKPKSEPASQAPPKSLLQPKPAPSVEVKLQTPKEASDPGGTIDTTAQRGETYRYTAQRVRTVLLSGHSLEMRSSISAPVILHVKDTFPPQTPTGLAAVPGGITPADASIDLSWEPDTDADLAGYIVYRQPVTPAGAITGPATRLNATPIVGPAYRDQTAVPGQRYAYRVTAVDTVGNESAPSADVQERLREQ
jgi:hypothetical protein